MPEAGWLLLFLFLGVCSLIVVGVLWPSFRRTQQQTYPTTTTVTEAHAFTAPQVLPQRTIPPPVSAPQKVKVMSNQTPTPRLSISSWLKIVNEQPDDAPHTLIIGSSGSGKTTLAHALATTRSGKLAILDPKWSPDKWGGLPAVPIDDTGTYTQIEEAIKALLDELQARLVLLKQGADQPEDLTIIAEELPTLVDECPSASSLFKKVGRMGRELRIRLVGLSQSDRVKSLGIAGEGDAKDNFTIIRLGKAAVAALLEARSQSRPAVLEWRGEVYLMETAKIVEITRLSIPPFRSWAFLSLESSSPKQGQNKGQSQTRKQEDDLDRMFLTFSAAEVGQIAVLVIKGMQRKEAIRAMPRYNRRQHKEFAAFYDALKESMEQTLRQEQNEPEQE